MAKRKKYYKKEEEVISVKKLSINYELRFNFVKKLAEYIKSFPKEHRSVKIESVIGLDGVARDQWVRVIRDVQMGPVISFMLDNNIQFKFENLTEAELNVLRADYLERQRRLAEIVRLKGEKLDVSNEDYSFMKIEPFEYQKKAIKFFEINDGMAILGDQPGVGKSLPAFSYAVKHNLKSLVICPASLKLNWKNEIMKFTGHKSFIYKYKPNKRSGSVAHTKKESLFHITNFESLGTFIKLEYTHKCSGRFLGKQCTFHQADLIKNYSTCPECENKGTVKSRVKGVQFFSDKDEIYLDPEDYDLIIIDECHKMKEAKTKWTQIIKLAFRDVIPKKLLLSGTVIKNRPMEMFVPLNFLDKSQWNSSHQFGIRYCAGVESNFGWDYTGASHLEELFERVSPYFLRRLKSDVLKELPPKTYMHVPIELSPSELNQYIKLEKEMREVILEDGTVEEQEEGFLAKVHKLKQFTGMLKLKQTKEMVQDIIDGGEKVVIMSDYQAMAEDLFSHFGDQSVIHTGSMNMDDKEVSVNRFQTDKKIKVFCGMIGASGVGITLTKAHKLIKIGASWSPADEIQAEDRIHRASTEAENILIIKFYCADTIDEDIEELLNDKADIASRVMDNKVDGKKVHKIENTGGNILGKLMKKIKERV